MFLTHRLPHHDSREAKQLKRCCEDVWGCCDCGAYAHRHMAHRTQTCEPAHKDTMACQSKPAQEAWRICKHVGHSAFMCRMLSRCSTFSASVSFMYPNTLQNHSALSFQQLVSHRFSSQSPVSSFPIIHNGWRTTRWEGEGFFLISAVQSSKAKENRCFSLGSLTVLNQILIKIIELVPKIGWTKSFVSTWPGRGSCNAIRFSD